MRALCAVSTSPIQSAPSPFTAPQRDLCRAPPPPHVCSERTPEGEGGMATDDADGLVPFRDVRVIRVTAPALLCRIGDRSVWLPRRDRRQALGHGGSRQPFHSAVARPG